VQHGKHDNVVILRTEVNGIREGVQQGTTNITTYRGKLEWPFANAVEGSTDVGKKSFGKACPFVFVPSRGILEIGLGKWPNDEPAGHSNQLRLSSFLRSRS
jgi:hypothetical protein